MKWLLDNLSNIKDILWILFTLIATTITVLTYRRAKQSLLQPLRTEVVKRQTDLLVKLLDFLCDDGVPFAFKVDYMGIISCNAYILLKDYGFLLKNDEVENKVQNNISGMLILKESGVLSTLELPNVFSENKSVITTGDDASEEKYNLAKKGIVELEFLHLTKQHQICMEQLTLFINNPFLPIKIKIALKNIEADIFYNLKTPLRKELEKFVVELCNKKASEDSPIKIDHNAIYNYYQRNSRHSKKSIDDVRRLIRDYLMVDTNWK